MKNWKSPELFNTPLKLVIALGLLILVVEFFIMTVIQSAFIPLNLPEIYWHIIDSVLLTLIISPALYSLVFQKLQSEERFRQINASAQDAIVIVDEQGRFTDWNPAAQRIFQYSREEALGRQMHRLLAPHRDHADADRGFAHFQKTGEGPMVGKIREVTAIRKDGSEFPIEIYVSALKERGCWHAVGIMRDITGRKRAEAALRELNEELEKKVKTRTADLEHAMLEAKQANRAKSDFLATMSHEIRTPMNGVIGMIDVLHQSSLHGYQVEMVDLIRESAYSLLGIINDILDFSRIEANKLEIEHAPTRVDDVVGSVCGMLDSMAEKKGVELTLFVDPAIPAEVLGDTLRLRQVLINLSNNAIKFSGKQQSGRVSVRALLVEDSSRFLSVRGEPVEPPNPSTGSGRTVLESSGQVILEFRVTDNGIGMNEQTLSGLFTPFTQADISTTRRFGGTGLGLSIVRHLVELMGGKITVQSELGKGSTFCVRIPFDLPPEKPGIDETPSPVAGLSCLVVGGPESLADDLAAYLAHGGAAVERVADLAAAGEWMAGSPPGPRIVIIDAAGGEAPLDDLRAATSAHPERETRFVVIGRGQRREPRLEGDGPVLVDGNVLTGRILLKAVAIAAGRIREKQEIPPPGKSKAGFSPPSRDDALRRGRLILVAEDNDTNQKVILRQLALLGFAADVAENGRLALERWQSGDYALLLSDLHMPEMDGYELTAAIRAAEKGARHIPIAALTANALRGEAEHCLALGMDDYLSKPVQLDDLKAMLEKWLPSAAGGTPGVGRALPAGEKICRAEPGLRSAPLDVNVLKALVGDDEAVVRDFLHDFRASAAEIAAELKAACDGGQAQQAGALAHKLKSSARSVGALALGELCAAMERAGKAGDAAIMAELLPGFEAERMAVDAYLDSLLRDGEKS